MGELISVIVPVYNTPKQYLNECIKSVLKSSYSNIEILVVDDGSKKETAELCDILGKLDDRIRVIHQENKGVSAARNNALKLAIGSYIIFVDADDLIEETMISSLFTVAQKVDADITIGGYYECYNDGRKKEFGCSGQTIVKEKDEILRDFFTTNNIGWNVWAKLYKRVVIKNTCFVEEKKVAEDMFFNYQVLKKTDRIAIYGAPIYRYMKHSESVMSDTNCTKFFDSFYLTREVFDDKETDAFYKKEKIDFYLRNELFFFRFIYAKDKLGENTDEINNIRNIFLDDIRNNTGDSTARTKLEILMLKRIPMIFKLYSKISWWGGKCRIFPQRIESTTTERKKKLSQYMV